MPKIKPLQIAILGAGGRGQGFAELIKQVGCSNEPAEVVAVAEPREPYRNEIVSKFDLKPDRVFTTWEDFVAHPRLCDAVIVSTMDRDHVGPAVACMEKGYHIFLEKPMATSLKDCQAIEAAQRKSGVYLAVCHSLRYNKGFRMVKEIINSGRIGRVMTIDQLEQVAFWHQAHSFVRGNWGNEGRSTFMLLAKSCHDIDYIAYLVEKPCLSTSSFGSLSHFTHSNAPKGSTDRCTDGCKVEAACPYSAIKQYVLSENLTWWPTNVVSPVHTREAHLEAIKTGPYGRCVYRTDNDVVDHQVVVLEFAEEITATFTMTAFTQGGGRKVRVHGTQGEILFDEVNIIVKTFGDMNIEQISPGLETGGHGGGDWRVLTSWLRAINQKDPSLILTNAQESLRTHSIVFAAERSRREGQTIKLVPHGTHGRARN